MAIIVEEFEFHRDRYEAVTAAMRELDSAASDSDGWINLSPVLTNEEEARLPAQSNLGSWFSGRGPAVALATWTPADRGPKPRPAQIGISHGSGPKALDRLADAGVVLPSRWTKRGDHAKYGVVVDLPDDADPAVVVPWLIGAATMLRTIVEPGDEWLARVHRPS